MNHDIYTHANGETVFLTSASSQREAARLMTALRSKMSGRMWAVPTPLTIRNLKATPGPMGESLCHRDIPPRTLRSPIAGNPFVRLEDWHE